MTHPSRRAGRSLVVLALFALAAPLAAQEDGTDAFRRPGYKFLRQDEDWSGLAGRDRTETGDLFDPIKYVPLSEDGSIWVSFGGNARTRLEVWRDFRFGQPPAAEDDDEFLLSRAFLHGDLHLGEHLRIFAEGKTAQSTERELVGGRRGIDADYLDLQQLFVDVDWDLGEDGHVRVRPGRQMLLFGKQRLVSPLPWANSLRTWDGATAQLELGGWKLAGFYTEFVPVDKTDFNDRNEDEPFYGVYASRALGAKSGYDLYWLARCREGVTFNGTSGDEERHTLGTRVWGPLGERVSYEVEGAYQLGEVGAGDVSAWMFASRLDLALGAEPEHPRVFAGLDWASGDRRPGGDVQTFDQLYPLGHAYYGIMDLVGRQNAIDASAGLEWKPCPELKLELAHHLFWLADEDDALYDAGAAGYLPGGSSSSTFVGNELDLVATRTFGRHVALQAGYGHFFAGEVAEDASPGEDVDFLYASLEFTF